ncbi:hypothetical protein GCM10027294_13250 [Marinactinospora endophytica]
MFPATSGGARSCVSTPPRAGAGVPAAGRYLPRGAAGIPGVLLWPEPLTGHGRLPRLDRDIPPLKERALGDHRGKPQPIQPLPPPPPPSPDNGPPPGRRGK